MSVVPPLSLTAALAILVASTPAALAQLSVLDAFPMSNGSLSSAAPSNIGAIIQSSSETPGTLQVFVEEYPIGSGCGGGQHHTNGGRSFPVSAGPWKRRVIVPWFGHQTPAGFLQVGARLSNGEAAFWPKCLRFGP
jgi:hypothetical protein